MSGARRHLQLLLDACIVDLDDPVSFRRGRAPDGAGTLLHIGEGHGCPTNGPVELRTIRDLLGNGTDTQPCDCARGPQATWTARLGPTEAAQVTWIVTATDPDLRLPHNLAHARVTLLEAPALGRHAALNAATAQAVVDLHAAATAAAASAEHQARARRAAVRGAHKASITPTETGPDQIWHTATTSWPTPDTAALHPNFTHGQEADCYLEAEVWVLAETFNRLDWILFEHARDFSTSCRTPDGLALLRVPSAIAVFADVVADAVVTPDHGYEAVDVAHALRLTGGRADDVPTMLAALDVART